MLTVVWSKRQIPGSPFKVIILAKGDPSKVTVVAKDKTEAVAGLERSWTIDKRSAGLGNFFLWKENKCVINPNNLHKLALCLLI